MSINRQPAGSVGADGKGTGGRFDFSIKDFGDLPRLGRDDSVVISAAMAEAYSSMRGIDKDHALACFHTNAGVLVQGALAARSSCPHCGSVMDDSRVTERVERFDSRDTMCFRCSRGASAISLRSELVTTEKDEDIADAIKRVAQLLKRDALLSMTSEDQRDMEDRELRAHEYLLEWAEELNTNPRSVIHLPVTYLSVDGKYCNPPSYDETSVLIDPRSLDVKLSSVCVPSALYDYLDPERSECALPLPALRELASSFQDADASEVLSEQERNIIQERLVLSVRWAELHRKEVNSGLA